MWKEELQGLTLTVTIGLSSALGAVPMVDGSNSVSSASSLIVVREHFFDNVDISNLGLLDWAAATDQFWPNPPPWGAGAAVRVQSLFVRVGWSGGEVAVAGTLSFSSGVSVLGVVTDIDGNDQTIWGAPPQVDPNNSQLARAENIFGVGMGYNDLINRRWDVDGFDAFTFDSFDVDRVLRTVTFSAATRVGAGDDIHVLIAYAEDFGPNETFSVSLSEGDGLYVGADFLGGGQEFLDLPLTRPALVSSEPPVDGSLPKTQNNLILLTFDEPITLPGDQPISIFGGGFEEGGAFAYSVEADGVTVKAVEEGPMLTDQTWYRITPLALEVAWFAIDVCTLRGDANGSGRVTTSDYSQVKAHMGEYTDARYDLNGSGRVTTADYSFVKAHLGNRAPPKP